MAAYFFHIELPVMNESIIAVIPAHRLHINNLLSDGKILSYSVSESRNMIWCVVEAADEQEAMQIVLSFPLYPHFADVACHPLLFHNTFATTMPGISLN